MSLDYLKESDPTVFSFVEKEYIRQRSGIELIASENYCSRAVMDAQSSCFTWKYAEGLPEKRYYGGCENVDAVESLCIERALKLFKCADGYMVNVQPHSGAQANMAAFMSVLNPGDTVLGMSLNDGGHLSHGFKANFSGKFYNVISYGVTSDGEIDYESIEALTKEHHPKLIVAGASAYSGIIDWKRIAKIAHDNGALMMADIAHYAGLIAGDAYPSPFGFADIVTTTTHKTLRGPRGGMIFAKKEFEKRVNSAVFPGCQGGPLEHIIAAKAVCLNEALMSFKTYAASVVRNAKMMASVFTSNGINVVGNGTESHMILLDLRNIGITGKDAQERLEKVGITTNRNMTPNDTQSPSICSGLRIGTAAITSRRFNESDCMCLAQAICQILKSPEKDLDKTCEIVEEFVQEMATKRTIPAHYKFE